MNQWTKAACDQMTKREAIAAARAEADALIEQAERRAKGWDSGLYRSDDVYREVTIRERIAASVETAFYLSARFATA